MEFGSTSEPLLQLLYSGGTQASAAVDSSKGYTALKGSPDAYVGLTDGLGFVRVAQDNGAKIKLDYNRVRIVSAGLIDNQGTNLVQVTFIHLVKGEITADSGTVSVTVQNIKTSPNTWTFEASSVPITVQHTTDSGQDQQQWPPTGWTPPEGAIRTVVVFTEIQVEVSIR
jgi:hypothetical protein